MTPTLVPPRRSKPTRNLLLYIEDDEQNWDVAEYRLGQSYDMLRAANAEEACQLVRTRAQDITAILMDIELSGSDLNGIELTEILRGKQLQRPLPSYAQKLPLFTKPIIFVTAHGARYTDVELMLFGADKAVAKPVDFASLTLALSSFSMTRSAYRP